MKRIIVISTSLRHGSNSDMLADKFVEGVNEPKAIEGNAKLQEAFELGKSV